jgi:hypothetical protein
MKGDDSMKRLPLGFLLPLLIGMLVPVSGLAETRESCLVRMIDNLNDLDVLLESRHEKASKGATRYFITSDFSSRDPWTEEIIVPKNPRENIITDAGVPDLGIREILSNYLFGGLLDLDGRQLLKNGYARDGQLTWIIESRHSSCDDEDLALIVFMVEEWFFFG